MSLSPYTTENKTSTQESSLRLKESILIIDEAGDEMPKYSGAVKFEFFSSKCNKVETEDV